MSYELEETRSIVIRMSIQHGIGMSFSKDQGEGGG